MRGKEVGKWERREIGKRIDRNVKEHDGYMPEGAINTYSIQIGCAGDRVACVTFEDKYEESGYWHDNPNYPYRDIKTTSIVIDDPKQIQRLARSLYLADITADALIDSMAGLFSTQEELLDFLNHNHIAYIRQVTP